MQGRRTRATGLFLLTLAAGCGGGGSTAPGPSGVVGLELTSVSVSDGQVWQINRPIELEFSLPVDFSTVHANTVQIVAQSGVPATGTFSSDGPRRVVFQPTCPAQEDYSDAGLTPGGESYLLRVLGADSGALTILSADGAPLVSSQTRTFSTPVTLAPDVLFIDPVPGGVSPLTRVLGSTDEDATHLEVGGARLYFEADPLTGAVTEPTDQPLNLYSDPGSQLAFVLELDQPVSPSTANVSPTRTWLEYELAAGAWKPLATRVTLEQNCTESGATVRLEPLGVLPQLARVRAVISPEFEDLRGETNLVALDSFASIRTTAAEFPTLPEPGDLADEFLESFDVGGDAPGSMHDASADFVEPGASWGDGELIAVFAFSGTGGPGGEFDVLVEAGETVVIDTTFATVSGGPFALVGTDSDVQTVVAGRLDVRNLRVEPGGVLRAIGPNPLVVLATGVVEVLGEITVSGNDHNGVATLGTAQLPEPGASGNAGGGSGGAASWVTTSSTPAGAQGEGMFRIAGLGGGGGESAYGTGLANRRPGGGGGGVFGPDQDVGPPGTRAEPGENGSATANGALGNTPPLGGAIGTSPFIDGDTSNDFMGRSFDGTTLVVGELAALGAGEGGGGGGDSIADNEFPADPWNGTDQKGAGGGGGAGALMVLALVRIEFGPEGRILARGGAGGAGESDVGGGGGGGSGGHIVLQSAIVDFTNAPPNCLNARGGRGGTGQGGAFDATSAGGDGGPGIIQVHVQDPAQDLLFAGALTLAAHSVPDALALVPLFGPRSRARSRWIALGEVSHDPFGAPDLPRFRFGGTDPADGVVLDADGDGVVDDLPPLLGPTALAEAPSLPHVAADGRTLVVDATPLEGTADDVYLRNPLLLAGFALDLDTGSERERYDVATASWDADAGTLSIEVTSEGPPLDSLGAAEASLVPRYFRVTTAGIPDALPPGAEVYVRFEGAAAGEDGQPASGEPLVPLTGDVTALELPGVAFVRFDVLFDIDADGEGATGGSPLPALAFTRIPFRF